MEISQKSSFVAFELTAQEEKQGYTLSGANRAVIQNLISGYAEDLLRIRLDGKLLTQEEEVKLAYTKGAIDALKVILATADSFLEDAETEVIHPAGETVLLK